MAAEISRSRAAQRGRSAERLRDTSCAIRSVRDWCASCTIIRSGMLFGSAGVGLKPDLQRSSTSLDQLSDDGGLRRACSASSMPRTRAPCMPAAWAASTFSRLSSRKKTLPASQPSELTTCSKASRSGLIRPVRCETKRCSKSAPRPNSPSTRGQCSELLFESSARVMWLRDACDQLVRAGVQAGRPTGEGFEEQRGRDAELQLLNQVGRERRRVGSPGLERAHRR